MFGLSLFYGMITLPAVRAMWLGSVLCLTRGGKDDAENACQ